MDLLGSCAQTPFFGVYILLLPIALFCLIIRQAVNFSVQGGARRIVGIIVSPILGMPCVWVGWWMAYVGYLDYEPEGVYQVTDPVAGWIGIVFGGIYTLIGTLYSAFGHEKL